MKRILAVVFLLCTSAFGVEPPYRYFILTPARLLNEQEQADLASRGCVVEKPLTGHRYLVRLSKSSTVGAGDPRVASLAPLTGDRKLHSSVLREIADGKPYARVTVLFQDEVSFAEAKGAIEAAGGTLVDPLQIDFQFPRRIAARWRRLSRNWPLRPRCV